MGDSHPIKWHVQISAHKDGLALKLSLGQVANALLGHGSDDALALALKMVEKNKINYRFKSGSDNVESKHTVRRSRLFTTTDISQVAPLRNSHCKDFGSERNRSRKKM